jgi:predicted glycosyltransferase
MWSGIQFTDSFTSSRRSLTLVVPAPAPGRRVVASVGGGSDGFAALRVTIQALESLKAEFPDLTARLFAGPLMPKSEYETLREMARPHHGFLELERFSSHLLRYTAHADVAVTMGGYNSLLEAVLHARNVVVIPRVFPRQEQLIRALAFERAGLLQMVDPYTLCCESLQRALHAALTSQARPARPAAEIAADGTRNMLRDIRHHLTDESVTHA